MPDDEKEFLDDLLQPDAGAADDDGGRFQGLAVEERCASSEELEQEEADYLAAMNDPALLNHNPLWPVPFIDSEGKVMLSKQDVAELKNFFGVTEDEYRQLYEVPNEQAH